MLDWFHARKRFEAVTANRPGASVLESSETRVETGGPARLLKQSFHHHSNMNDGIAAMVHVGAWLANEFDLEILSCGRAGLARKDSCKLELCGKYLLFDLTLDGTFLFISATPLDRAGLLEALVTLGDTSEGWAVARKLVAALEHNEVKSLAKPISIGEAGSDDAWVIA